MVTLRSGLVIAGGYADKVRRVLFAQLKNKIKSGELESKEIARAAGELNRLLFEMFVTELRIDKGDVVRITVDYDIENGRIEWKLGTLKVEIWRRISDREIESIISEVIEKAEEIISSAIQFTIRREGKTDTDDLVYTIIYENREAGALLATPINGKAIIRGAVVEPTPLVLKKSVIEYEEDLDDFLSQNIVQIMKGADNTEKREAERIVREIKSLIHGESFREEDKQA